MTVVLLDTSVVSLFHPRRQDDPRRKLYEPIIADNIPALSFQSVAELWKWAEERRWGPEQRKGLHGFIRRFTVFSYDYELAQVWAKICVTCQRQGRRLEEGDAWIVATAAHRTIPLITHDKHMLGLKLPGLEVISYLENV